MLVNENYKIADDPNSITSFQLLAEFTIAQVRSEMIKEAERKNKRARR